MKRFTLRRLFLALTWACLVCGWLGRPALYVAPPGGSYMQWGVWFRPRCLGPHMIGIVQVRDFVGVLVWPREVDQPAGIGIQDGRLYLQKSRPIERGW